MIPWCERPELRESYEALRRKLIAEGKLEPDPLPIPPMATVQTLMREWKERALLTQV
jgi:hypothetical protein